MSVLVVGTFPPPGGAVAQSLCRVAAERVAQGDEVELLSPDLRSATHRHARLSGLWLALALARAAPRFDELVLRVEQDLPLAPRSGRTYRAATLLALGMALRLFKKVTLRLDTPIALPGGLGGRATVAMWRAAGTIVVANDDDAKNVRLVRGVNSDAVVIEAVPQPDKVAHVEGWDVDLSGNVREEVLGYVSARAARDRATAMARHAVRAAPDSVVDSPFSGTEHVRADPVEIARLAFDKLRRQALRALSAKKA